jgi:hypothetical protein
MSDLMNTTTLKNDTRFEDFLAETKALATKEANSSESLTKTAIRLVRESASGVVEDMDQVKQIYNLHQDTIRKRDLANPTLKKVRKPMTKRSLQIQQSKLGAYFNAGQIKSVKVQSDDTTHDYSGEAAMDHASRLYKDMTEALPAYTAYGAAAARFIAAAEANASVTDAELIQAMTDKDKAAKKVKTAKDVLSQACIMIGKIMNGTMKGVEQDNAKEVQDTYSILNGYLARLTLKEEHDAFVIRAAKVGYQVAKLESNPRPLAGRKRTQRRG